MSKLNYETKRDIGIKVLGNECSRCKNHEGNPFLQFDYLFSNKPKRPISYYLRGEVDILLTEIDNYRLLCPTCYEIENRKLPRNTQNTRFEIDDWGVTAIYTYFSNGNKKTHRTGFPLY